MRSAICRRSRDIVVCPTCLGEKPLDVTVRVERDGTTLHFCGCPQYEDAFRPRPRTANPTASQLVERSSPRNGRLDRGVLGLVVADGHHLAVADHVELMQIPRLATLAPAQPQGHSVVEELGMCGVTAHGFVADCAGFAPSEGGISTMFSAGSSTSDGPPPP